MSEDRVEYRAGARVIARVGGLCALGGWCAPGALRCSLLDLLPVAARYATVRELGAVGVTAAVVVCRRCGRLWHLEGIGPDGVLSVGEPGILGELGARGVPFLAAAQVCLDLAAVGVGAGLLVEAPEGEEDPFAD